MTGAAGRDRHGRPAKRAAILSAIPTLETARLLLRPFELADAPQVQRLAGAWEVANTMLTLPHPYPDGAAKRWIATHAKAARKGKILNLAVCLKDGMLIGGVSLMGFDTDHRRGELGYWIGKEYWGQGYCSEAAGALVRFGFERLGLNRIYGQHMSRNAASGRVLQKIGLKHEGCLRQHLCRWDRLEDVECWGILKAEWASSNTLASDSI
jgi:[ribosomal protein S5]-alanine N-acetyltransferase